MAITLSDELERRVHERLATGLYQSVDDVLFAAMRALNEEEQTIAAIAEGFEDFEAGRFQPLEQADAEFRRKHGIPPSP
jgi:putative addiction module CopG family antidote